MAENLNTSPSKVPYYQREKLTGADLQSDPEFLNDAVLWLRDRTGGAPSDPKKIVAEFAEVMRYGLVNEWHALQNLRYVRSTNEAGRQRTYKMYLAYDRSKGATDTLTTVGDFAAGFLTAPSTIGGFLTGGVGFLGKGAVTGSTKALSALARNIAMQSSKKKLEVPELPGSTLGAITRGGLRATAVEAPLGALHGYAHSATRKETGGQEYSNLDTQTSMLLGAGLGTAAGLGVGGVAGGLTRRSESKALELLGAGLLVGSRKADEAKASWVKFFGDIDDDQEKVLVTNLANSLHTRLRADWPINSKTGKPVPLNPLQKEAVARGEALRPTILQVREAGFASEDAWRRSTQKGKGGTYKSAGGIFPDAEEWQLGLSEQVFANMISAAAEILYKVNIKTIDPEDRVAEIVFKALVGDDPAVRKLWPKELVDIKNKYGFTYEQFSHIFIADASAWGRRGLELSRIKQAFRGVGGATTKAEHAAAIKASAAEISKIDTIMATSGYRFLSPEVAEKVGKIQKATDKGLLKIWKGVETANKARLGMMTAQTATTLRNTSNAVARTALYALDNMFYGGLMFDVKRATSGLDLAKNILSPGEVKYLKLIMAEDAPEKLTTLFRQLADIDTVINPRSKFIRFSMFLNRLNTLSDNQFKGGVFMTELRTALGRKNSPHAWQRKDLRQHLRERTLFSSEEAGGVPDHVIGQAMNEALFFTYQASYRGKKGMWNQIGDQFIRAFSHPALSVVVPFPRFIVNALEFSYKHAPLIGILDPALFGRAFVGKQRSQGEIRKRVAEQLTGLTMLYGAIQLRAMQGPEARWWQTYNKDTGEYENAMAYYGPFAPWMLMADMLVRNSFSDIIGSRTAPVAAADMTIPFTKHPLIANETHRKQWEDIFDESFASKSRFQEFLKGSVGSQFRAGFGGDILDSFIEDINNTGYFEQEYETDEEGNYTGTLYEKYSKTLGTSVATYVGNLFNSFLVPFGEVRDVMAIYEPKKYETIMSTDSVNPFGELIKVGLRSLPITSEGRYFNLITAKGIAQLAPDFIESKADVMTAKPLLVSTSDVKGDTATRRMAAARHFEFPYPFGKGGLGPPRTKNIFEKELDKLRIAKYEIFPEIPRDAQLTRMLQLYYQDLVRKQVMPYIATRQYQDMSMKEKRDALVKFINAQRGNILDKLTSLLKEEKRTTSLPAALDNIEQRMLHVQYLRWKSINPMVRSRTVAAYKSRFDAPPNMDDAKVMLDLIVQAKKIQSEDIRRRKRGM